MQNLLQLYQQLNLAYYTSLHSFCQNNFGPQKSNLHPLLGHVTPTPIFLYHRIYDLYTLLNENPNL